jgi:hypothetical protein
MTESPALANRETLQKHVAALLAYGLKNDHLTEALADLTEPLFARLVALEAERDTLRREFDSMAKVIEAARFVAHQGPSTRVSIRNLKDALAAYDAQERP